MRLFLSDSFFDRFTDLPRNVQQDVRNFQRKFRDNSISSAIHLEPITQFRDSSLRSARVNQAYRAILGSLGQDNFVLLYVDKHDVAYDWAKNKKFQWNEHTQSCQIIPISIEQVAPVATQPMSDDSSDSVWADITDEQLLSIGVPEDLIALTRSITGIDDLERTEANLPQDAFENIFAVLDGIAITEIIEDIEAGKARAGEDSLLSDNNKRRFIEITDDEYLAKIMEEGMEKWQIFLHPSQSKLVNANYRGTVKVSGSAGTGKTIAAIHRLKHLSANPEANILFTTYTTTLVENIRGLIEKLSVDKRRYTLNNIDKVLVKVAKELHLLSSERVLDYEGENKSLSLWSEAIESELSEFDEEFLSAEYADVIQYNNLLELKDYLLQSRVGRSKSITRKQKVQIWKLKERYEAIKKSRGFVDRNELFNRVTNYLNDNDIRPYSNVIVDEFQDFSNPELRFIRALTREGANDIFLVGDPFQRIYVGRRINFSSVGLNVRGKRSMKLKVNYRTTEEIKRMAVSVLKGLSYDDLDGGEENNKGYISLVHGDKPSYRLFSSRIEEIDGIVKTLHELMDSGIDPKDICIAASKKSVYKDIQSRLHREDLPYNEILRGSKVGDSKGVSLCTFHSLKGLEFRVVMLTGVNEYSFPSSAENERLAGLDNVERKEKLSNDKSLLYVAITRARQLVYITGNGIPTGHLIGQS